MGFIINNVNYSNLTNQNITHIKKLAFDKLAKYVTDNCTVMTNDYNMRVNLLRSFCDNNASFPTLVIGTVNKVNAGYEIGNNILFDPFCSMKREYIKPFLTAASRTLNPPLSYKEFYLFEAYYDLLTINNVDITWKNLYNLCKKPLREVSDFVGKMNVPQDTKSRLNTSFAVDYTNQVTLDTLLLKIANAFGLNKSQNYPLINFYQMCLYKPNDVMFLPAPQQESDVFYDIIAYEIGLFRHNVCVILDSVTVQSDTFSRALVSPDSHITFGVFASDARRMFTSCNIGFPDILSASDCIVAFNQTEQQQANAISEALGTYEKRIVTRQVTSSTCVFKRHRSNGTSESVSDTPRVSTAELRKLGNGCVLFNRNSAETFLVSNVSFY